MTRSHDREFGSVHGAMRVYVGDALGPDVPHLRIGVVDDASEALDVQGQFVLPLAELRAAHEATLPAVFES